jgi:hypothetical protein
LPKGAKITSVSSFADDPVNGLSNDFEWAELLMRTIQNLIATYQVQSPGKAFENNRLSSDLSKLVTIDWTQSIDQKADFKAILDLAWKFPFEKTAAGFCFRLFNPDYPPPYFSRPSLDPCGCNDAGAAPPDMPCSTPYPFRSTTCFPCMAKAIAVFNRFQAIASSGKQGVQFTEEQPYGPFSLLLTDPDKVLAQNPLKFRTREAVDAAVERMKMCLDNDGMHAVEHVLLRPIDLQYCNPVNGAVDPALLPVCPAIPCPIDWEPQRDHADPCATVKAPLIHYLPGADPYSFWATIALPDWTKRFRTAASRHLFEQLLYLEAPALVGLNILWLSPHNMCKFETELKRWLEWLECPDETKTCMPMRVPPQLGIVNCIRQLQSTDPCPTADTGNEGCGCPDLPTSRPAIKECCAIPFELTGSMFWADCNGRIPIQTPLLRIETPGATLPAVSNNQPDNSSRLSNYNANILAAGDQKLRKSNEYNTVLAFMQEPSVAGFADLTTALLAVGFKTKQKPSDQYYTVWLQNCLLRLFDLLTVDEEIALNKKTEGLLKTSLDSLAARGISLPAIAQGWQPEALPPGASAKRTAQLLKLLQTKP